MSHKLSDIDVLKSRCKNLFTKMTTRVQILLLILFVASCNPDIMEQKYDSNNIFYDLQKMGGQKSNIIKAVHEKILTSDKVLGIDKSYIKSMTYRDIYTSVSDSLDKKKQQIKEFGKLKYSEEIRSKILREREEIRDKNAQKIQKKRFNFTSSIRSGLNLDEFDANGLNVSDGKLTFNPSKNKYLQNKLAFIDYFLISITFKCIKPDFIDKKEFIRSISYQKGDLTITRNNKEKESVLIGNGVPCEEINYLDVYHTSLSFDENELDQKFPQNKSESTKLNKKALESVKKPYFNLVDSLVKNTPDKKFIKLYPEEIDKILKPDKYLKDSKTYYNHYTTIISN